MDYSLLPGQSDKNRSSPLVITLLVAVCCLAAWNTYLTLALANDGQMKTGLQQEIMEEYIKTIFHNIHNRHHHDNNSSRNKRSVGDLNEVANLIEEELKYACPGTCPAGPVGPAGPTGPAGPLAKPQGCLVEEGYDYRGQDIPGKTDIPARDVDHCAYLCTRDDACKFWTFNNHTYVCHLKTSAFGRTAQRNAVSGTRECGEPSCESPWTQLSTGCYRFMELPMNYPEAQEFCHSIKAQMVEIESEEENNAILQELTRRDFTNLKLYFWLGLSDTEEEGDWEWVSNGKNPSFTDWRSGQPDNHRGDEHCAHIGTDSKWNDFKCKSTVNKRGYSSYALCEK